MPCDSSYVRRGVTLTERKNQIQRAMDKLNVLMLRQKVKPVIDPLGRFVLQGWSDTDRDGVTDICAYKRIMQSGTSFQKLQLAQAAARAGRTVDKQALAQGIHSHDGGATWGSDK